MSETGAVPQSTDAIETLRCLQGSTESRISHDYIKGKRFITLYPVILLGYRALKLAVCKSYFEMIAIIKRGLLFSFPAAAYPSKEFKTI